MDGRFSDGFTLPEMMASMVVMAGLLGWGIPTFRDLALDGSRAGEVNQFLQSVHLARSEAIKRNGVVSLCPSGNGATCTGAASWQSGWIVFVNLDADSPAARDAGEDLLRIYPAWNRGAILANRPTLSFRPFGQSGVTATVTFCDDRGPSAARAVIISQSGRPRVSDRSASGAALVCP